MTSPSHGGLVPATAGERQGGPVTNLASEPRGCQRTRWIAGLGLTLCLVGEFAFAESTPEGTIVGGVRATKACITEEVRITGFAVAREQSGASLPLSGYRITDILVGEGDKVKAEQELLRAVRDDSADSSSGSASSKPSGPASVSLRAPMGGTITQINIRIGSISGAQPTTSGAAPPSPQIMIEGDSGADLIVDVPSLYASRIRKGGIARVIADGGIEVTGTVGIPVSEIDARTQLGRARLSIDPAAALRAGQFASAIIETAYDCGVTVPRSAVSYQNGAATVQVLNGSAVETRSVRTGLSDATRIQIRDGISEGQPIVANAGMALRPGDRVTPLIKER